MSAKMKKGRRKSSIFGLGKKKKVALKAPEGLKQSQEAPEEKEDLSRFTHHFKVEKIVSASPEESFDEFVQYVWNENGGIGFMSFTYIGEKEEEALEEGHKKSTFGVSQEVIKSEPGKRIVYQVLDGPFPTEELRGEIKFAKVTAEVTKIIWLVDYIPQEMSVLTASIGKSTAEDVSIRMVKSVLTAVIPKMLNNLERRIQKKKGLFSETSDKEGDKIEAVDDEGSEDEDEEGEDDGEEEEEEFDEQSLANLQWAARMSTGYEGHLTKQQKEALAEFKQRMQKSKWAKEIANHPDGDRWLLRFLRAECTKKKRRFRLDISEKRLLATMEFRDKHNALDKIENPPANYAKFEDITGEFLVVDKEGRPTVFTRAGYLANYLDVKVFSKEEWTELVTTLSEKRMHVCRESSERLGHEVSAAVVIYDLKGMSLSARRIIPFVKIVNSVASAHYPEFVDRIILSSAPSVFSMLWKLVKNILDPVTREKVKVYSASETKKLHEFLRKEIDPDVLPEEFGGKSPTKVPMPYHARMKGFKPP